MLKSNVKIPCPSCKGYASANLNRGTWKCSCGDFGTCGVK